MEKSIFVKIIQREIPATIVFEDEQVIAFEDIQPKAPIHIIIVPKKIITTLNEITPEDNELLGYCLNVAKKIAFMKHIHESGYRVVMNCNYDGGQTVYHLHFHLLGGHKLNHNFA
ncbi:MAG: histidine triad nucleotide-binding protein [Ignavibacteria bacterium]|nr:histidine triad nucleotide-binding protein [Ignavibacteria bacterium]